MYGSLACREVLSSRCLQFLYIEIACNSVKRPVPTRMNRTLQHFFRMRWFFHSALTEYEATWHIFFHESEISVWLFSFTERETLQKLKSRQTQTLPQEFWKNQTWSDDCKTWSNLSKWSPEPTKKVSESCLMCPNSTTSANIPTKRKNSLITAKTAQNEAMCLQNTVSLQCQYTASSKLVFELFRHHWR